MKYLNLAIVLVSISVAAAAIVFRHTIQTPSEMILLPPENAAVESQPGVEPEADELVQPLATVAASPETEVIAGVRVLKD